MEINIGKNEEKKTKEKEKEKEKELWRTSFKRKIFWIYY